MSCLGQILFRSTTIIELHRYIDLYSIYIYTCYVLCILYICYTLHMLYIIWYEVYFGAPSDTLRVSGWYMTLADVRSMCTKERPSLGSKKSLTSATDLYTMYYTI